MVIINFYGGLGNQMFQYAFYRKHELLGKKAGADIEAYNGADNMTFCLDSAFPGIVLNTEGVKEEKERIEKEFLSRNLFKRAFQMFFPKYKSCVYEKNCFLYNPDNLRNDDGCYYGYWQTDKYWKDIKDVILNDFTFGKVEGSGELESLCQSTNSVALHIRRGDYMKPEFFKLYGNIATDEYYENAIKYFSDRYEDVKFIVFSNDADWVRENYKKDNFIIAADYLKKDLPDWYEMYLMSLCKHNIIANSTFSWWGAYLNKNPEKTVVAPKKWINGINAKDIYPEGWINI